MFVSEEGSEARGIRISCFSDVALGSDFLGDGWKKSSVPMGNGGDRGATLQRPETGLGELSRMPSDSLKGAAVDERSAAWLLPFSTTGITRV